MLERVIVQTCLCCYQVGNGLCMLTGNDRVIEQEVVQSFTRVFKEELNHLDSVRECIDWHLVTLSDSNELLFVVLNTMTSEEGEWFQMSLNGWLVLQVGWTQSRALPIEELCSVEDCLFLFTGHFVEKVSVVGVLHQVHTTVRVLVFAHIRQYVALLLLRANPC